MIMMMTLPKPGSFDYVLWQAYIEGASWGDTTVYPDFDDVSFYEFTPHGHGMLRNFWRWREPRHAEEDLLT